ncbi:hypothetical protein N7509_011168 [Penicillium cosmopolitanum]|uniref:Uncharacterized protein n=1 Tax=Penicillium cosmopolitanum TaxID=1131564 RepID=A0A9X0B5C7_9EURO|nr:uncharacterized protein N7509_011168 [Penicillium cosmopolitanum]KAJ5388627.1 hypothetical protein N7509_011168 [Penicillium cosmopolitanum]
MDSKSDLELQHELDRDLQDELEELKGCHSSPLPACSYYPSTIALLHTDEPGSALEHLAPDEPFELSEKERPITPVRSNVAPSQDENSTVNAPSPEDIRNASYRARAGPYCLHETVQRYWSIDPFTPLWCENKDCGRPARFLYECTADTAEFSPFVPSLPERSIEILPTWVQKAIGEGRYLPAQVEKLMDQKMKVLETAANLREQVPPTHRALPGGRGLANDQEAIDQRDYRELMQLLSARTLSFSNLEPCRAMFCTMCRSHTSDNSWGSIAKVVNEPYEEPLRTPANICRPVIDVWKLRGLPEDPTHWQHTRWFREWWGKYQYPANNDVTLVLNLVVALKLPFLVLQSIQGWVCWQQMPPLEFQDYLTWLETLTPERLREHADRIGDPWELQFQAEAIAYSYLSPGTPSTPLSIHPIWEEVEDPEETSNEKSVKAVPHYEYGPCDRFVGRSSYNLRDAMWNYNHTRSQFLGLEQNEDNLPSAAADDNDLVPEAEPDPDISGVETTAIDDW